MKIDLIQSVHNITHGEYMYKVLGSQNGFSAVRYPKENFCRSGFGEILTVDKTYTFRWEKVGFNENDVAFFEEIGSIICMISENTI